jgi:hypothetical protein
VGKGSRADACAQLGGCSRELRGWVRPVRRVLPRATHPRAPSWAGACASPAPACYQLGGCTREPRGRIRPGILVSPRGRVSACTESFSWPRMAACPRAPRHPCVLASRDARARPAFPVFTRASARAAAQRCSCRREVMYTRLRCHQCVAGKAGVRPRPDIRMISRSKARAPGSSSSPCPQSGRLRPPRDPRVRAKAGGLPGPLIIMLRERQARAAAHRRFHAHQGRCSRPAGHPGASRGTPRWRGAPQLNQAAKRVSPAVGAIARRRRLGALVGGGPPEDPQPCFAGLRSGRPFPTILVSWGRAAWSGRSVPRLLPAPPPTLSRAVRPRSSPSASGHP